MADIHALRVLRQYIDALAIAALAGDPVRTMIVTQRLRRATYRACRAADAAGMALLGPYINRTVQPMISLAWQLPGMSPQVCASALDDKGDDAPHLVGLEGTDADLHETSWHSLHVAHCALDGACLRDAVMDNAVIETCNLTRSNLAGTSWRWARVSGSIFVGASLANATLEYARFVDCDFRGADFSAILGAQAPAWRASFIRCDLRDTSWRARSLGGVMFMECKVEGMHGDDLAEAVEITAADGAAPGDDTEPLTPGATRRWLS